MPIDYDKLAADHGGTVAPAVDYDALASAHGGTAAAAPEPDSAGVRFVKGAASQLNPVAAVKGVASAVAHPIDTLGAIVQSHIDQATKAKKAYDEGRYTEAAGHLGAAALPLVGPAAAGIGERISDTGDIATGVGEGAGLIASLGVPKALPAVVGAAGKAGAAVGRAGQAVGEAASVALEHPIAQAVAQKAVKHGATVAGAGLGASMGGPVGAFVGGTAGREFGATIAERMAARAASTGAKSAPVAASVAETAADLASGRPIGAADYIEKLHSLPPEEQAKVIAARQTSSKATGPAETAKELTQRVSAEHRAQYYGPEAPRTAAPEQAGQPPQAPPVVEAAPTSPGEPAATAPPEPAPAPTAFNPSKTYDAARKAFADAGEKPGPGELSWITEYVRRGLSVKDAVRKVIQTRKTVPASTDPAAELAARLGTPSPAAVEESVRARNASGRWAAR